MMLLQQEITPEQFHAGMVKVIIVGTAMVFVGTVLILLFFRGLRDETESHWKVERKHLIRFGIMIGVIVAFMYLLTRFAYR